MDTLDRVVCTVAVDEAWRIWFEIDRGALYHYGVAYEGTMLRRECLAVPKAIVVPTCFKCVISPPPPRQPTSLRHESPRPGACPRRLHGARMCCFVGVRVGPTTPHSSRFFLLLPMRKLGTGWAETRPRPRRARHVPNAARAQHTGRGDAGRRVVSTTGSATQQPGRGARVQHCASEEASSVAPGDREVRRAVH